MSIPNPTGTGVGRNFLMGLQERNQRNLVEVLKAAEPVIEEIAKVKPESWRNMRGLFTALEGTFGVSRIGAAALRPVQMLQNRAMNTFEGLFAPIMVGLNNISNQVEAFAMANQRGATIGAGIGFMAGFLLPGSNVLWAMAGAYIGARAEADKEDWRNYIAPFSEIRGGEGGSGDILQVAVTETPIVQIPTYTPYGGGATAGPFGTSGTIGFDEWRRRNR